MPQVQMKARLIRFTPDPEEVLALAAKMCTSDAEMETLLAGVEGKDISKFLKRVIGVGHMSITEHCSFTFLIEGVSRALLAQITRHRIASFSVQSQRYVTQTDDFGYIVPPSIEALGEEAVAEFGQQMRTMQSWYTAWLERIGSDKAEDARFVLPNACQTRMIVTMNGRELLHFFQLRCCNRAQWEIRALAWEMLRQAKATAPTLFENAGPACLTGPCPEGKRSCGQAAAMKQRAKNLTMEVSHEE